MELKWRRKVSKCFSKLSKIFFKNYLELINYSSGLVTLNLYGGKFYKGGDKSGSGSSSIWDRKSLGQGKEKKSKLSNIKTTFFTPIGTQSSGYKRSKGLASSRKYSPEEDQTVRFHNLL